MCVLVEMREERVLVCAPQCDKMGVKWNSESKKERIGFQ